MPGSNFDLVFWSFPLAKKQKHKSASKKNYQIIQKEKGITTLFRKSQFIDKVRKDSRR